jgi:hypothetical protein
MHAERYIVAQCVGCDRVSESLCTTYHNPGAWFRWGKHCPLASHIKSPAQVAAAKVRVGQQKQKKAR